MLEIAIQVLYWTIATLVGIAGLDIYIYVKKLTKLEKALYKISRFPLGAIYIYYKERLKK